ncbi:hypothetical protein [Mycoplasmopsis agalactiae]|uniref:hypothetical protein n=1 Tax=Mycoplasmopsis agalactiae TaxID=2110 RepID=UPI001F34CA30|nr:hypothetical protein [Mycoplasmopsis agalactiae]
MIERESQSETVNYDVIYIDPPYNTESSLTDGNNLSEKDEVSSSKFIYRDKFSRTGWLNMLNERLRNNIATNVCYERLYRINNGISTNNESNFDWIKKNEPYKSNLNVYNIEYYSTKLFDDNQSNMSIKNQYIKMLQDFGINTENKDSNIDILRSLTSLKPISKEDTDAIKQYTKQSR